MSRYRQTIRFLCFSGSRSWSVNF